MWRRVPGEWFGTSEGPRARHHASPAQRAGFPRRPRFRGLKARSKTPTVGQSPGWAGLSALSARSDKPPRPMAWAGIGWAVGPQEILPLQSENVPKHFQADQDVGSSRQSSRQRSVAWGARKMVWHVFRANGPASCQPSPTGWVSPQTEVPRAEGPIQNAAFGPISELGRAFSPECPTRQATQADGLGWHRMGRWPARNPASPERKCAKAFCRRIRMSEV
jgi:hypothetical protein